MNAPQLLTEVWPLTSLLAFWHNTIKSEQSALSPDLRTRVPRWDSAKADFTPTESRHNYQYGTNVNTDHELVGRFGYNNPLRDPLSLTLNFGTRRHVYYGCSTHAVGLSISIALRNAMLITAATSTAYVHATERSRTLSKIKMAIISFRAGRFWSIWQSSVDTFKDITISTWRSE